MGIDYRVRIAKLDNWRKRGKEQKEKEIGRGRGEREADIRCRRSTDLASCQAAFSRDSFPKPVSAYIYIVAGRFLPKASWHSCRGKTLATLETVIEGA